MIPARDAVSQLSLDLHEEGSGPGRAGNSEHWLPTEEGVSAGDRWETAERRWETAERRLGY